MQKKIAIVIIAAGSSSRLGQAKQLLPYKNTFLLGYVLEECLAAKVGDIIVVLGANRVAIASKIQNFECRTCYNPNWATGMGTSIACGIAEVAANPLDGAIIVLSDQPFFDRTLLHQLLAEQSLTNAPIVASKYQEGMGPPAFFAASLFPELQELQGDVGAKPLVKKYFDELAFIPFPKGNLDIDTEADLVHLV